MIGREDIKVLFIGSDTVPSTCGPDCKATHAATHTQEPHYPVIYEISHSLGCVTRIPMKAKKGTEETSAVTVNHFAEGK